MKNTTIDEAPRPAEPWWRHGIVWLVIAGPALVVVASFVTLGLALRYPDPALSLSARAAQGVEVPAIQARNHAATPAER